MTFSTFVYSGSPRGLCPQVDGSPGAVARPQRPHHGTCRSASGGSGKALKPSMLVEKAHESETAQRIVRDGLVHVAGSRIPPRAAVVHVSGPGPRGIHSKLEKPSEPGAGRLPLAPDEATQFSSRPRVQLFKPRLHLDHPEVRDPAPNDGIESRHGARDAAASTLLPNRP